MTLQEIHDRLAELLGDATTGDEQPREVTGPLRDAVSAARAALVQSACTHPGQPIRRWVGTALWEHCRVCGKELSFHKPR